MPNIAAIDVGSNAMRMAIAKATGPDEFEVFDKTREPIRLGKDVFLNGKISEQTMALSVEAFNRFRKVMDSHNVKLVRAIATSAVREAQNRRQFIDQIRKASGIQIEVIDGHEEARLVHEAVLSCLDLDGWQALLIDIGGGSVELTLSNNGRIRGSTSLKLGTVRLMQMIKSKKSREEHLPQLIADHEADIKDFIKSRSRGRKVDVMVGTGGNLETIGELRTKVFKKSSIFKIQRKELDDLIKVLKKMNPEKRGKEFGLRPDRADVIVPAAFVLQMVAEQTNAEQILIPHVGLKDGVIYELAKEVPRR